MKPIVKLGSLKKYDIIKRENRFVVTVANGNKSKRALLSNTGRLLELIQPGYTALCLDRNSGKTNCEIIGVLVDDNKAAIVYPYTQVKGI